MSSSENETISLDHIHREPANPGEQLSITGSRDLLTAAIRPPRSRIIKIINSTARNEILKTLLHSPTRFIWLINTMSIFDLYSKCEASEKISMRCDKSVVHGWNFWDVTYEYVLCMVVTDQNWIYELSSMKFFTRISVLESMLFLC